MQSSWHVLDDNVNFCEQTDAPQSIWHWNDDQQRSLYNKLQDSADQEMQNVKGVSIYEVENEPISKAALIAYKLGEIFAKCPHM